MKKYCNFQIIFHNYYYFLGVNDCGDNSDEPANCQNDCSIALSAYAPEKICDANLDCIGEIKIFFSFLKLQSLYTVVVPWKSTLWLFMDLYL